MKPFLILQLRPETEASDSEFHAILKMGGLAPDQVLRIRLDRDNLPGDLRLQDYSGVIVGGGPGCVSDPPEDKSEIEARIEASVLGLMPEITKGDVPFLGCCYGIGILTHHLNAPVSKQKFGEPVGTTHCSLTAEGRDDPILQGISAKFDAFVGHKEAADALPDGCAHLVSSPKCPYQMIRFGRNVYATQFHPEADADEFELRIRLYRDRGYFRPEDADQLIQMCRSAEVTEPGQILRNFVTRYQV